MGEEKKKGFFGRLVEGLTKTRKSIASGFDAIFSGFSKIDEDFYEELEEVLVMADLGIHTKEAIIEDLKEKVHENHIKEPMACKQLLIDSIKEQMSVDENAYEFEKQESVVLVIGVNGVGKTTSVGKLAGQYKKNGKKVIMAAADTFRAGAIEQLTEWSKRAGVDIIAGQEGSDPAAVIFDAIAAAKARKADILLCDTAGRLHNKKNLMEELRKINRIIDREYPQAYRENLIVLDGTTGQNALAQARQFKEVADITGIVLTKLDGTAKGGIAIAIQAELGVPVKFIGVGEQIGDLQKFDANAFVDALFASDSEINENTRDQETEDTIADVIEETIEENVVETAEASAETVEAAKEPSGFFGWFKKKEETEETEEIEVIEEVSVENPVYGEETPAEEETKAEETTTSEPISESVPELVPEEDDEDDDDIYYDDAGLF